MSRCIDAVAGSAWQTDGRRAWKLASHAAVLIGMAWLGGERSVAQDPFGGPDPFSAKGLEEKPAAAPVAPKKDADVAEETDPHVLAIRNLNPQTPEELTTAVQNLMNLGRPDEAKRYLQILANLNLDAATLAALQRQFGSALFIRMLDVKDLDPVGRPFADAVLNAGRRTVRDPARLETLVRKLSDPTVAIRVHALAELRMADEEGVVAMIRALADTSRVDEHPYIRAGLNRFGRLAEGPLLGTLGAPTSTRDQALIVLARVGSRKVLPFLLRPAVASESDVLAREAQSAVREELGRVPLRHEAEQLLQGAVIQYFDGRPYAGVDHENLVKIWNWDPANQQPVAARTTSEIASLWMAERLAGELVALAEDNLAYKKLHVATLLEMAKLTAGWNQPLERGESQPFDIAAQLGTSALEDVLEMLIARKHVAGAVATLEVLGEIGRVDMLTRLDGQPSPVGQAVLHPDRRVAFAAMQAILKIDPQERYPGSSFVAEALAYFVHHSGARRVLVASPQASQAHALAGLFAEFGFLADVVHVGGDALQLATDRSDYELVVVSDWIDRPGLNSFLQQLRRAPRSANLPVGVVARPESFAKIQRLAEGDPLTIEFPIPQEPAEAALMVKRLLPAGDAMLVPLEERQQQAVAALEQMARLGSAPQKYAFYELARFERAIQHAMSTPVLTDRAAQVLGLLATPDAQRSLIALANQHERPLTHRQAAAKGFQVAVDRSGLLLSRSEILAQYDNYNASATADELTQQLLGSVLDTIESRGANEANQQP